MSISVTADVIFARKLAGDGKTSRYRCSSILPRKSDFLMPDDVHLCLSSKNDREETLFALKQRVQHMKQLRRNMGLRILSTGYYIFEQQAFYELQKID